jgi:hypothetical protein
MKKKKWDVFISHASEDKDDITDKIVKLLEYFGIKIWYDKDIFSVGDSLSKSIDIGLANSRYGIIILSENFIKKGWTEYEFRALLNREVGKKKVILPIWHKIDKETIEKYSPFLLEKYALDSTKQKLEQIVIELIRVIKPIMFKNIARELLWRKLKKEAKTDYVKHSEIKKSEIRHEKLPKELMLRITNLYYSIFIFLELDLQKMIDGFKRDLHPDDEVIIWEFINLCLQQYFNETDGTDNKRDIISQLLLFSMGKLEKSINISDEKHMKLLELWAENFPLFIDK